jgi:hypothetical protein
VGGGPLTRLRRLAEPRPAPVRAGPDGSPAALGGVPVEAVAEDWTVEDRWWIERPLRRRYFELVLEGGRNAVVFRDLIDGRWYEQRA